MLLTLELYFMYMIILNKSVRFEGAWIQSIVMVQIKGLEPEI